MAEDKQGHSSVSSLIAKSYNEENSLHYFPWIHVASYNMGGYLNEKFPVICLKVLISAFSIAFLQV